MTLEKPPLPITFIYSKSFFVISLRLFPANSIKIRKKVYIYLQNDLLENLHHQPLPMIYKYYKTLKFFTYVIK